MADLNFEHLKIYFDGGSRNNPGPSAVGVILYDKNNNIIDQISEYIGVNTNNITEYTALEKALNLAKKYKVKYNINRIIINTDSKLLYNQIKRFWRVNDKRISEIHKRIINKLKDYEVVDLRLIPRQENKQADKLVNLALDNYFKQSAISENAEKLNLSIEPNQKEDNKKLKQLFSDEHLSSDGIRFGKIQDEI